MPHPSTPSSRRAPSGVRPALMMLGLAWLLVACGSSDSDSGATQSPASTPSASATAEDTPADEDTAPGAGLDPVETYLAWLEASRIPDVEEACGYLSDELIDRMLAEMAAGGYAGVQDCAQMTTLTADLYRTFNQGAEVDVQLTEETAENAELFVTYLDSGECGTIALTTQGAGWIITEQSEGCGAA